MGGSAGLHNTVFTKLLSKKGDFLARLVIENVALPLKLYILSFKSQIWRID